MNIYLVSQDTVTGYDTYDSMVVVAESEEAALDMHPVDQKHASEKRLKNLEEFEYSNDYGLDEYDCDEWCPRKADVTVQLVGVTPLEHAEVPRIIITSFKEG